LDQSMRARSVRASTSWKFTGSFTCRRKLAWSTHDGFFLDQPWRDCGARSMPCRPRKLWVVLPVLE
jgi:hypothetical protein